MTNTQAYRLLESAMLHDLRPYNFDANLYARGLADSPSFHNAFVRRRKHLEALAIAKEHLCPHSPSLEFVSDSSASQPPSSE